MNNDRPQFYGLQNNVYAAVIIILLYNGYLQRIIFIYNNKRSDWDTKN